MSRKIVPIKNEQGFKIIVMPAIAQHALFDKNTCDLCGEHTDVEADVYYEAVIDQFYCERCHKLYLKTAVRYYPDIKTEEKNYEKARRKLEGAQWWQKKLF